MASGESQLDEFLSYLDQSVTRIEALCDSTHNGQCRSFKKALLFTFIDNLSTLAFPGPRSTAKKVKKLVVDYGHWQESHHVSTPHLCRWIELNPEGLLQRGNEIARAKLQQWERGCLIPISSDLDLASVQRMSNPEQRKTVTALTKLTHFSLLWNQRHSLLHRFMPIGMNLEFPDDQSPYYISLSSLKSSGVNSEPVWQLIYPTGFLFRLARACLAGVSSKLRNEPIDLRAHYQAGLYLLEELNQQSLTEF